MAWLRKFCARTRQAIGIGLTANHRHWSGANGFPALAPDSRTSCARDAMPMICTGLFWYVTHMSPCAQCDIMRRSNAIYAFFYLYYVALRPDSAYYNTAPVSKALCALHRRPDSARQGIGIGLARRHPCLSARLSHIHVLVTQCLCLALDCSGRYSSSMALGLCCSPALAPDSRTSCARDAMPMPCTGLFWYVTHMSPCAQRDIMRRRDSTYYNKGPQSAQTSATLSQQRPDSTYYNPASVSSNPRPVSQTPP